MIAKGNFHGSGVKLAAYLVKPGPGERAELVDMRGFAASDLRAAFRDQEILAREGTHSEKPFFHVQLRAANGEGLKLKLSDWAEIANRCDQALGVAWTQQPRAASMHIDQATGDRHMHLAYSRLRMSEDGRLHTINPGLFKKKLKGLAREIEKDFGLKIVSNERAADDRARAADRREHEESRRLGTDLKTIRGHVLDCFSKSDNGKSFVAAIKAHGMELANGDRRDCFVVIDHAGGQHALNKTLTGLTLAAIRDRLADLDRSKLPTVEQAQEIQLTRQVEREKRQGPSQTRDIDRGGIVPPRGPAPSQAPEKGRSVEKNPLPELGKTAGKIRLAWRLTGSGKQFAQEIENRGMALVYVTRDQADDSHRVHAFAKAVNRQRRELREGFGVVDRRGNVTRIDQRVTGDLWEEIQKRLGSVDKDKLLTVAQARDLMQHRNREEFREQKQAERNAARPATAIEIKILDADKAAAGDHQKFADELRKEGIGLARVTASDIKAIEDLRRDEQAAAAADIVQKVQRIGRVEEGQLVAVMMKSGDVISLNPHHMAALDINRQLEKGDSAVADQAGERTTAHPDATENFKSTDFALPSVIQLRSDFESVRKEAAAFQQTMIDIQLRRRDDAAMERLTVFQERAADREVHSTVGTAEHAVDQGFGKAAEVVDTGFSFGSKVLDGVASGIGKLFSFLVPAPAPTRDQAERNLRVADENNLHAADDAAVQQNETRRGEQIARQDEEQSQHLTAPHYFRPITRPIPGRGDDRDDGIERERERER